MDTNGITALAGKALTAPSGMIVRFYGPCIGTYNDCRMIGESRLIDMLRGDLLHFLRSRVQRDLRGPAWLSAFGSHGPGEGVQLLVEPKTHCGGVAFQ